MSDNREIEAKFELSDADLNTLANAQSVGPFAVSPTRTIHQDDTYYDTPDGALHTSGASVRVRRNEAGTFMTFKADRQQGTGDDAHIASRIEDEIELPRAFVATIDTGPLPEDREISPLQRARKLADGEPLYPLARMENERIILDLSRHSDEHIELSLDRCTGTRFSDGRVVQFDEAELEIKNSDRETLRLAVEALRSLAPGLTPSGKTKLERTLGR
jgi:inorganic triphosphatase YgiF